MAEKTGAEQGGARSAKGPRFVSLELRTPRLCTPADILAAERELARDFPWIRPEGWQLEYWGVRSRSEKRSIEPELTARGPRLPDFALPTPVLAALALITHLLLTLVSARGFVLLAPAPWSGLGGALARRMRRSPPALVVRVQGRTSSRSLLVRRRRVRAGLVEAAEGLVLRDADLVLPMGEFTRSLARRTGVDEEKMLVVPFPSGWRASDLGARARSANDDGGRTILCAARLVAEKGVGVLLRAFALVVRTHPESALEIAGEGSERDRLEGLAQQLGVSDRVGFRGWVRPEMMPAFLRGGSVLVLPSLLEEGLGMVLVEAGLAECALVGSDLGGIREIVRPGVTGMLVPPGDHEALAAALTTLLASPDLRRSFGANARRVSEEYLRNRSEALLAARSRILNLVST